MTDWLDLVRERVSASPIDVDTDKLTKKLLHEMSTTQLREAAFSGVRIHVEAGMRARVRALEEAAAASACTHQRTSSPQEESADERYERLKAQYGDNPQWAPKNTRIYKEWLATPEGQRYLAQEKQENDRREAERERVHREFGGNWILMGLHDFEQQIREQVRLELTDELLAASFALGDGTRVTWGEATIEQHRQRELWLIDHAGGTLETAQRHEVAIKMIESNHVACLRDIHEKERAA